MANRARLNITSGAIRLGDDINYYLGKGNNLGAYRNTAGGTDNTQWTRLVGSPISFSDLYYAITNNVSSYASAEYLVDGSGGSGYTVHLNNSPYYDYSYYSASTMNYQLSSHSPMDDLYTSTAAGYGDPGYPGLYWSTGSSTDYSLYISTTSASGSPYNDGSYDYMYYETRTGSVTAQNNYRTYTVFSFYQVPWGAMFDAPASYMCGYALKFVDPTYDLNYFYFDGRIFRNGGNNNYGSPDYYNLSTYTNNSTYFAMYVRSGTLYFGVVDRAQAVSGTYSASAEIGMLGEGAYHRGSQTRFYFRTGKYDNSATTQAGARHGFRRCIMKGNKYSLNNNAGDPWCGFKTASFTTNRSAATSSVGGGGGTYEVLG